MISFTWPSTLENTSCGLKSVTHAFQCEKTRLDYKLQKIGGWLRLIEFALIMKRARKLSPVSASEHNFVVKNRCSVKDKIIEPVERAWTPSNWQDLYSGISRMRSAVAAPVDTMGCDIIRSVDYDEKTNRYHVLVSLMLSSQTKDEVNNAAMERLLQHGLTPTRVSSTSEDELGSLIKPVSFWRTKAKHIKQATEICCSQYNSDIPPDLEGLLALPGVGPKMAYLAMSCAWKKVVGIGVDVHVHRISNRLQWVPKPTKTPEQTRLELESWLPQQYWGEVNHMLVGFGQTVCLPKKPKCSECAINNLCPSAFKTKWKNSRAHQTFVCANQISVVMYKWNRTFITLAITWSIITGKEYFNDFKNSINSTKVLAMLYLVVTGGHFFKVWLTLWPHRKADVDSALSW